MESGPRSSPRLVPGAVAVVVVVAALVIGDRLDPGKRSADIPTPAAPSTSASPRPSSTPQIPLGLGRGRLDNLTKPSNRDLDRCIPGDRVLARCGPAPALRGISRWFNTRGAPVAISDLRGKVVLLDFFAPSCGACRRDQPYVNAWQAVYADYGLAVIGIATPLWDFEAEPEVVASTVRRQVARYPVGLDDHRLTFGDYRNRYWPAKYLIDATGTVRAITFGEGEFRSTEALLRALLIEAAPDRALPPPTAFGGAAPNPGIGTEIYLGTAGTEHYQGSPALRHDETTRYRMTDALGSDSYTLGGEWTAGSQALTSGHAARLRVQVDAGQVALVAAGRGEITVREPGLPTRTTTLAGLPGAVPLIGGQPPTRHVLDISLSPGLRVYAVSVG